MIKKILIGLGVVGMLLISGCGKEKEVTSI